MRWRNYEEEGLLKAIKISELSEEIAKLNWNWDNYSDPIKIAHGLLAKRQKLFIEISEYVQIMNSNLTQYQLNQITDSIEDLGILISYMKKKIKPSESFEHEVEFMDQKKSLKSEKLKLKTNND